MDPELDELAGVVDSVGGLTRSELLGAVRDLAARSGEGFDADALEERIDEAVDAYALVAVPEAADAEGPEPLLVAGPTALPALPEGGEDLPHLLDVEPREVDPDARGAAALAALREDAAAAVNAGDVERIEDLLSTCYDLEAWAPVDTEDLRQRLADTAES